MSVPAKTDSINPAWKIPVFARRFLITIAAVVLIAAVMNLLVDPYSIYNLGILPRVEVNFYERKLALFQAYQPRPQVLILGSSRVIAFDPETVRDLTGKRCFNFALPGARTETFYSVLKMAIEDYDAPIDTVIVGVDPESFHPAMPIQPEARFIPAYSKYFIHDKSGQASAWEKLGLLLTLNQTSDSINSLVNLLKRQTGQEKMEFRSDGYSVWVQLEKQISEGTFDFDAKLETRVRKYPDRSLMLRQFTTLSDTRKLYWEDFLALCKEKGIKVYAFLPPYHPRLLQLLDTVGANEILGEVSGYLDSTVESEGGVFRDYMDVESFGGDPGLFYDEIHMRPANAEILLGHLLENEEAVQGDPSGRISADP